MSDIREEVEKCLLDYEFADSGDLRASFKFPEAFIGFQGHFPGNKVLPGICQIQCVIVIIEKWKKSAVILQEIVLAKFTSPVLPEDELKCTVKNIEELEGVLIVKALFTVNDKKIGEMKLKVRINGG